MLSRRNTLGRAAALVLGVLFVVAFAHAPLLRSGLVASDHRALAQAAGPMFDGEVDAFTAPAAADAPLAPLAHLALRSSRGLAGVSTPEWSRPTASGTPSPALLLRLEGLFYLGLGALGLALFVRRLLLPWTGSVHAAAAGWAAALVFLVHPLSSVAVAGVALRGQLLAVVLALWSGAFFLRGRQDRRVGFTVTSFVLCGLGGFASNVTLGLPVLFACAEFVSAHRYRTVRGRLRTTMTTLVVFGIAASLELMLHVSRLGVEAFPSLVRAFGRAAAPDALASEAQRMLSELGTLALPASVDALGPAGFVLAGAIFLGMVQPALVAARSAPRLWTLLLLFFVVGLALTLVLDAGDAMEIGGTPALFASAAVVAAGAGVASTALSGARRRFLPVAVALGYAILSHGNALGWRAAGEAVDTLRQELREVVQVHGSAASIFVVDPPRRRMGVTPLDASPAWLLPGAAGRGAEPEGIGLPRVRALGAEALRLYSTTDAYRLDRRRGLVLLLPPESDDGEGSGRTAAAVAAARASAGPRRLQNELSADEFDLDTAQTRALLVRATAGADPERLERVGWTSSGQEAFAADLGVWIQDERGPLGIYHLAGVPRWLAADRVRSLRFERARLPLTSVEVVDALPVVVEGLTPRVDGADWTFAAPVGATARAELEDARWALVLLDLATLRTAELEVVEEPDQRTLRAPSAAQAVQALLARAAPEGVDGSSRRVLWSLERRRSGRVFAQNLGEFRGASPPETP